MRPHPPRILKIPVARPRLYVGSRVLVCRSNILRCRHFREYKLDGSLLVFRYLVVRRLRSSGGMMSLHHNCTPRAGGSEFKSATDEACSTPALCRLGCPSLADIRLSCELYQRLQIPGLWGLSSRRLLALEGPNSNLIRSRKSLCNNLTG
jgi:hypothetical protein